MTRILVVDDEAALRNVISDVLVEAGYVVSTATNGAEALAALQLSRPDVLLLDLVMPGVDGWAFLESYRTSDELRGLPIGIMSAAPSAQQATEQLGIVRLIAKPFDLDLLLETVGELATHSVLRYGRRMVAAGCASG